MKFILPVAAGILLLFVSSCKKDSSAKSPILYGNWAFANTSVLKSDTVWTDIGGGVIQKTVTIVNYTTTDNKGVYSFGADGMKVKGLSFALDYNNHLYTYENNVETDVGTQTTHYIIDSTDYWTNFKLVGADSIYFPGGDLLYTYGESVNGAEGGRYNIDGITLTIVMKFETDRTQDNVTQKHRAMQTTVFTRQ